MTASPDLKRLPLHDLHVELGGKIVPFAGYEMAVQYPLGVMKEHNHTREKAGLFDVSHMGQCILRARNPHTFGTDEAHAAVSTALETLIPGEIKKLSKGKSRYSVFLNEDGGILDDLMITRPAAENAQGALFLVVNAAVKDQDFALMDKKLAGSASLEILDRSLLALQGPKAAAIIHELHPETTDMAFMSSMKFAFKDDYVIINRCGYTGEDGFEISCANHHAEEIARKLLSFDDVEMIGLGARDSLRLEVGLCLYGHDMNDTISPAEANISFCLGKRRKAEANFPGAGRILGELKNGTQKLRVGILPEGRAPIREGAEIQSVDGDVIGTITSGGFGPTKGAPVAMGYVAKGFYEMGTKVNVIVRGKALPATVAEMPFVPQTYFRKKK